MEEDSTSEIASGTAIINKIDNEHIEDQLMIVDEVKQIELVSSGKRQTVVEMENGSSFTMSELAEKIESDSFKVQSF